LLAAAIARPKNKFAYDEHADSASAAAAYAYAIAKTSHPFLDGNKRAAWITALTFIRLNGFAVHVT
jgi:death on curing protein